MTPLNLILTNFRGIKSGLGTDRAELDLTQTEGELIALAGPNGAGKSTMLDNLHPYRLMPGRATSYSPGAFSFYDHVDGPAAEKILTWTHDGVDYRSHCVWKQTGKTRKAEAYLFVIDKDGDQPFKANDGTVSDGKTDTYDRCVTDILGPPEVFFTAAFAAQGRAPLAAYGNADIKALMSEILGLDNLQKMSEQAADVARRIEVEATSLNEKVEGADAKAQEVESAKSREKEALEHAGAAKTQHHQREVERDAARKTYAKVEAKLERAQEIEAERQRIIERGQKVRAEKEQALEKLDQAAKARELGVDRNIADLDKRTQSLGERIAAKEKKVAEHKEVLGRAAEIDVANKKLPESGMALEGARANLEKAQAKNEQGKEAQRRVDALEADERQLETREKSARASLEDLVKRAGMIASVPCQDQQSLVDSCPLLANAREAKSEAGTKRAEAERLEAERNTLTNTIEQARRDLPEQVDVEAMKRAVEVLQKEERLLQEKAKDAPKLEMAQFVIAELGKEILELSSERANVQATLVHASDARREYRDTYESERQATERGYDEQLQELRDQLSKVKKPEVEQAEQLKKDVEISEAAYRTAADALEQARTAHAKAQADREALERSVPDVGKVKEQAQALNDKVASWRLLAKALGPNGIIALSVDDAGPGISDIANKLLMECFGPRYTVAIRTQRETRTGTQKEVFDVVVFDASDGSEKPFTAISGGQKVYINEALTRAVAIFQAQSSGRRYGTLFADESDGALDVEKKRDFVKFKRKVLELGGYYREFFITHTPALLEAADTVIDVEGLVKQAPPQGVTEPEPMAATGR